MIDGVLNLLASGVVHSALGLKSTNTSQFVATFPFLFTLGVTWSKPRRSRIEITAELLEIASGRGATKTALVYKANLNFTLVQKYLLHLESKGMIERVSGDSPAVYKTTVKGMESLRSINSALHVILAERPQDAEPPHWFVGSKNRSET